MSTLLTIETIDPNLMVNDLHPSSQYYISVSICNYIDCGPSSSPIFIETPSSSSKFLLNSLNKNKIYSIQDPDIPIIISQPINKSLLLNCPLTNSWRHRYFIPHPFLPFI